MNEENLRERIGILLIFSHFTTILVIIVFNIIGWYDDIDMQVSLPILTPIFAGFSVIILRQIITNRHKVKNTSKEVTRVYAFLSHFIPIIFVITIFLVVVKQGLQRDSVGEFASYLGIAESVFAAYTGYIVKSLFDT